MLGKYKLLGLLGVGGMGSVYLAENTALVEQPYRVLGGTMVVIHKERIGHHPHGLDDPTPLVEFILKHSDRAVGRQ